MKKLSKEQKYGCSIAGLYLSLHDIKAYNKLSPNGSQKETHIYLASKLKVSPGFIKINRDEFDFHVDNNRVGFKKPLNYEKEKILEKFKNTEHFELYEELEKVLAIEYTTIQGATEEKQEIRKTKIKIREFNLLGNEEFIQFHKKTSEEFKINKNVSIKEAVKKIPFEKLNNLITNDDFSEEIENSGEIEINKKFKDRFELGHYLHELLKDCPDNKITNNYYLWNWITASLFQSVYPGDNGGVHQLRYVLSESNKYLYRHICYYSWFLYKNYGADAKVVLVSSTNNITDIYEQIVSNRTLLNKNVFKLLSDIYLIEEKGGKQLRIRPKVNSTKQEDPGTIRRVKKIIQFLETNYFISKMNFKEFKGSILESTDEFNRFLR